jgi:hypothetical protein
VTFAFVAVVAEVGAGCVDALRDRGVPAVARGVDPL